MTGHERGFTLIEILISLAMVAVIVIGAIGVLGATSGGLEAAFSTSFVAGRAAKDVTAASVYLQGLNEYLSTLNAATLCPGGPPCTVTGVSNPPGPAPYGYAQWPPSTEPYELDWQSLTVTVQTWHWNGSTYQPGGSSGDELWMVESTLTWNLKGQTRTLTLRRFVPYHPTVPL